MTPQKMDVTLLYHQFPLFLQPLYVIQGRYCKEKLDVDVLKGLIKTITKFLNVIGYHQGTNRTAYTSCS